MTDILWMPKITTFTWILKRTSIKVNNFRYFNEFKELYKIMEYVYVDKATTGDIDKNICEGITKSASKETGKAEKVAITTPMN